MYTFFTTTRQPDIHRFRMTFDRETNLPKKVICAETKWFREYNKSCRWQLQFIWTPPTGRNLESVPKVKEAMCITLLERSCHKSWNRCLQIKVILKTCFVYQMPSKRYKTYVQEYDIIYHRTWLSNWYQSVIWHQIYTKFNSNIARISDIIGNSHEMYAAFRQCSSDVSIVVLVPPPKKHQRRSGGVSAADRIYIFVWKYVA
jgi:hypothetical protein